MSDIYQLADRSIDPAADAERIQLLAKTVHDFTHFNCLLTPVANTH